MSNFEPVPDERAAGFVFNVLDPRPMIDQFDDHVRDLMPVVSVGRHAIHYQTGGPMNADQRATMISEDLATIERLLTHDEPRTRIDTLHAEVTDDGVCWSALVASTMVGAVMVARSKGTIDGAAVDAVRELVENQRWLIDERDRLNALLVDANGEISRLTDTVAGLTELNALNHHAPTPTPPDTDGHDPTSAIPEPGERVAFGTIVHVGTSDGWVCCPWCDFRMSPDHDDQAMVDHIAEDWNGLHQPVDTIVRWRVSTDTGDATPIASDLLRTTRSLDEFRDVLRTTGRGNPDRP